VDQIEIKAIPSLEISGDLIDRMAMIQRGMQDAVASSDRTALAEVDTLRDTFVNMIRQGISDGIFRTNEGDSLIHQFTNYYALAIKVSQHLLDGETGENIVVALNEMMSQYNGIKTKLEETAFQSKVNIGKSFQNSRDNNRSLIVSGVILLSFILILGLLPVFLARSLIKSMDEFRNGFKKLAHGDLTSSLTPRSNDEIGELVKYYNGMVHDLKEQFASNVEMSNQLSVISKEISTTTDQEVNGISQHSSSINQITTTLRQIAMLAEGTIVKADGVVADALQAMELSNSVRDSGNESIKNMEVVKEQVEMISTNIQVLTDQITKIDEIGRTITDISSQINIISLNVSIQASKSGTAGKEFTIIATRFAGLPSKAPFNLAKSVNWSNLLRLNQIKV